MLYVIDFGLSKRYKCPKSGLHIELKKRNGITGTPRYTSLMAHKCYEQSRRDDLESVGNILILFCKQNKLPWMVAEDLANRDESRKMANEIRKETSI